MIPRAQPGPISSEIRSRGEALLIDPVLEQVDTYISLLETLKLNLAYTLETHVHADHVTAGGELRERLGSKSIAGHRAQVACANIQVRDHDTIRIGGIGLEVFETPGHTDGCVSYVMLDRSMVFTGDALLISGCGGRTSKMATPRPSLTPFEPSSIQPPFTQDMWSTTLNH